jgi:hypothetical protein
MITAIIILIIITTTAAIILTQISIATQTTMLIMDQEIDYRKNKLLW